MRIAGECIVWLRSQPAVPEGAETRERQSAPTSAFDRGCLSLYPEEHFKPGEGSEWSRSFDHFQPCGFARALWLRSSIDIKSARMR
jgi:hypothetical protein